MSKYGENKDRVYYKCGKCCPLDNSNEYNISKCNQQCQINITDVTIQPASSTFINIKIYGSGFKYAKHVSINYVKISKFIIVNDNQITLTIPQFSDTSLYISVWNNNCVANYSNSSVTAPVITRINPAQGSINSIANVTIFGYGFSTLKSISCGNLILTVGNYPISIISDNLVSFIMPSPTTTIAITVTTNFGTSNSVYYTIVPAPII